MSDFYTPSVSFDSQAMMDTGGLENPYVDDWSASMFNEIIESENVNYEFPGVRPVDETSGIERVLNAMQEIDETRHTITDSMQDTVEQYSIDNQMDNGSVELDPQMQNLLESQQKANMHFFEVQENLMAKRNEWGVLTEQAAWTREISKKAVDGVNRIISNQ